MTAFSPECEDLAVASLDKAIPLEQKIKKFDKIKSKKVILISGPTACGKTTLSLILASMLNGEIVSADSMQVYKGMNIGTAKVSDEERERIPHHLIDIRHIQEGYNVVDFFYDAKQCCEAILARNRVPIVVGGSGFYFRALLYGPPEGPPSMPPLRHELEEEMRQYGSKHMYDKLILQDPEYAHSITQNDKHKIIRALEIITLTQEKVSAHEWQRKVPIPDFLFHSWFIYRPRRVLYPAIEERCEHMLKTGLLDEVKELEANGLRNNQTAAQAIGYRQALDYLDSNQSEKDYDLFVREFKTASRQYAKRQFTWFKKEKIFRWLNVDIHDLEIAAEMIAQEYLATI